MTTILETAQEVLRQTEKSHIRAQTSSKHYAAYMDDAKNNLVILAREVIRLAGIVHTLCDQRNCSPDELVTVIEREYQQGNDCADEVIRLAGEVEALKAKSAKFSANMKAEQERPATAYSMVDNIIWQRGYRAGIQAAYEYAQEAGLIASAPPEDAA